MRIFNFSVLLVFATFSAWAQKSKQGPFVYVNAGLGISTLYGGIPFSAGLVVTNDGIGGAFQFSSIGYTSSSLPADYDNYIPHYSINQINNSFNPFASTSDYPRDHFDMYNFVVVKEYKLRNSVCRWGFECGPSYINYFKRSFSLVPNSPQGYSTGRDSFYSSEIAKDNSLGIYSKLKVVAPTRGIGIEGSVFFDVNARNSLAGVQILFLVGHVMNRPARIHRHGHGTRLEDAIPIK